MSTYSTDLNGGALCRSARVAGNNTVTAGGAGDAAAVNGAWVDRKPADVGAFDSAKLVISYTTTLAAGATLKFGVQFRDATDGAGTGAANYKSAVAAQTAATGPGGGGTITDTFEIDIDISGAREFIQAIITPDLSAANTDTAAWSAVMVFFGGDRQPITKAPVTVLNS